MLNARRHWQPTLATVRQSVIAPQQARFGHSGKNALLMAGKICISPANSFNLPARLPTLFFAGKPPWPN
jgi:hypothetical protein